MKKLLFILSFFALTNFATAQIIVKETCHNVQYGITSDSVYIEISVMGKIDIRQSNIPHIWLYTNSYYKLQNYIHGNQPLSFSEIPNLFEYDSEDTDYYVQYKNYLLRRNPSWRGDNIIILSE